MAAALLDAVRRNSVQVVVENSSPGFVSFRLFVKLPVVRFRFQKSPNGQGSVPEDGARKKPEYFSQLDCNLPMGCIGKVPFNF